METNITDTHLEYKLKEHIENRIFKEKWGETSALFEHLTNDDIEIVWEICKDISEIYSNHPTVKITISYSNMLKRIWIEINPLYNNNNLNKDNENIVGHLGEFIENT
jgi:hypothetical protein